MDARLPAHLEVAGLIRRTESAGGFAAVIAKGERDAGTILIVLSNRGIFKVFERLPDLDGSRRWTLSKSQNTESQEKINEYVDRRKQQDADLWIVELDIPDGERFILET